MYDFSHFFKKIKYFITCCIIKFKKNSRHACAVESAALNNPSTNIFLMYASEVGWTNKTKLPFVDAIMSYNNVHISTMKLDSTYESYAQNTPLADWVKERKIFNSPHIKIHMNDFLRAAR